MGIGYDGDSSTAVLVTANIVLRSMLSESGCQVVRMAVYRALHPET